MENLSELIKTQKFVVVDLETTGLDKNRDYIIEIGAVKIEKGKITEKFSTFVSCPVSLPSEIVDLTGITENDLAGALMIEEALKNLKEFMQGCTLVAHNLPFDYSFLRNWGFWCGVDFNGFEKDALDTVILAKEVLKNEVENFKLSTLAKYFGIEFTHHRALNDAEATVKIFLKLAQTQLFLAYLSSVKEWRVD
jgi:DNA polymerase-3 subunit alpha (Gram-positive type)